MRLITSLRVRIVGPLAVALVAAACGDSSTEPTQAGAPALRFDEIDSAAVVAVDSTAVPLADSTVTLATAPTDSAYELAARPVDAELLVCPTNEAASAQGVIGPEGGSIGARGTTISIPAGAVPEPTLFEVVVPASQYLETEIHAVGVEHYVFQQPATITINTARCPDGAIPEFGTLQGAYIDTPTHRILQLMGGVDDRDGHKVSFETGHLSGYVVAF